MLAKLASLSQDLRYGVRVLAKSPGFSLIAILTLALGIGANTAIFSVVNGVLLNPLPYHQPDQLVSLFEEMPNFKNGSISYPNFIDWRRMNTSFSSIAAYRSTGFSLSGSGEPERLRGEMISAGFFEILGVNPLMGRTFSQDEVLKDGAQMTLAGIILGMAGAFALTRLMRSMLFGVKPTDPLTFVAVAFLLCAVAMLACYVPAHRAMKVDPIEALRHE